MDYIHVTHQFPPVFNENSNILILGSFPSVKSREQNFYYGHPNNRFWKMMKIILDAPDIELDMISQKKKFLLDNHIALWDVIKSCDIKGSSDSSIKNIELNDLELIINNSNINKILLNGGKAYELYNKFYSQKEMPPALKMPSTSPANAAWNIDKLVTAWKMEIDSVKSWTKDLELKKKSPVL